MVQVISLTQEFEEALKFDGLIVVDFFAEWCGPCKAIAPVLDQLSNRYNSVKFIKVDVDQLTDLARKYEVNAMPTFKFIKNGKVVDEVVGADPNKIVRVIDTHK
ncbi:thioredoxin [Kocuria palustris]|nr:thioredoxin [Kocuria palustris]